MAADTKRPAPKAPGRFKARFATGGRLAPVEDWLTQNISGDWTIEMESVSDDMSKKNYTVIFAEEVDRDSFKRRFILGKAAYEQKPPPPKAGFFSRLFGSSKPAPKPNSRPGSKPGSKPKSK